MDDVEVLAHVSRITWDLVLNRCGVVSARTVENFLAAARILNLDRSINIVPMGILRIAIVLQSNTNYYHVTLRQTHTRAVEQNATFNIQISCHYFKKLHAGFFIRTLEEAERVSDGLSVLLCEDCARDPCKR